MYRLAVGTWLRFRVGLAKLKQAWHMLQGLRLEQQDKRLRRRLTDAEHLSASSLRTMRDMLANEPLSAAQRDRLMAMQDQAVSVTHDLNRMQIEVAQRLERFSAELWRPKLPVSPLSIGSFLARLCSQRTMADIVLPILADADHEWRSAAEAGAGFTQQGWVLLRWYLELAKALNVHKLLVTLYRLYRAFHSLF